MKKIISLVVLTVVAVFSFFFVQSSKQPTVVNAKGSNGTIRVAINNNCPPFSYMKGNKIVGAEVDMWNHIGKKLNYKIKFEPVGFDVLFGKLDNHEADFASSYIAINNQRKKKYNFTTPYAHGFMKLLVLKKTKGIHGLQDCAGKKVAVTSQSNARVFLKNYIKKHHINIHMVVYEDKDSAAQALKNGDVIGWFEGAGTTIAQIQNGNIDGKFVGKSEQITDTAFMWRKGDKRNDKIGAKINGVIKEMKKDGELSRIYKKWVGVDITNPNADMSYITSNKNKAVTPK